MSWHRFTEQLREYFTFTRKERNGIAVLLILLVIMQGAILFTHYYKPDLKEANISAFEKEVLAFQSARKDTIAVQHAFQPATRIAERTATYFPFDPNTVSQQQWEMLGLNDRTIHSIVNYLSKGGHFYKKEDLKKIYNLQEQQYAALEPYILIAGKEVKPFEKKEEQKVEKKPVMVELNSASAEELMTLPFIGEKRAEQILKYRNRLGGFVNKEQLAEVYSIPDSIYEMILPHITLNTSIVQYINVNTISSDTVYHPYLKRNLLKLIISYRKEHGDYHDKTELKKLPLMTDSVYRKVEGYIRVE
jgi:competence protein ComEA